VYAGHGLNNYGALVLFAFNYCGGGGFAFLGEDVFRVGDEHFSVTVFAVHEVANPTRNPLTADVFHGHAADAGEHQDKLHGKFVFETG
jgi:hypothetical protein